MFEALSIYDRLTMKNEFLYTMRMLVMLLLTRADFYKLKDLMVEYRFFLSAEDEIRLENGNQNLNRNQAVNNFM